MNNFGRELQRLRTARGLSQRALARASGLTPAYLSLLEAGRRAPERPSVERLASALVCREEEGAGLLLAAGYAASVSFPTPPRSLLASVERLIADAGLPSEEQAALAAQIAGYAERLVARMRRHGARDARARASWQERVLEVVQEAIDEAVADLTPQPPFPRGA